MVNKISEETRRAINRKSAYALPDAPTEMGMGADEIKKAFWKPITDEKQSAISELDRVAEEMNAEFDVREAKLIGVLPHLEREIKEAKEHVETLQSYREMIPVLGELVKDAEESAERAKEGAVGSLSAPSGKLDKVTTTDRAYGRIYGVTNQGEQKTYKVTYETPKDQRIALYVGRGRLSAKAPIGDTDVANKAYVDKVMGG